MISRSFLKETLAKIDLMMNAAEQSIREDGSGDDQFVANLNELEDVLRQLRSHLIDNIGMIEASQVRIHPLDREIEDHDNPCHCCYCIDRRRRQLSQ